MESIAGLALVGIDKAFDMIIEHLHDDDRDVQALAISVLVELQDARAVPHLEQLVGELSGRPEADAKKVAYLAQIVIDSIRSARSGDDEGPSEDPGDVGDGPGVAEVASTLGAAPSTSAKENT